MNFKSIYVKLIGIALLCTITNSSFARNFILKNDSMFDIFYRCRSNAEASAGQNFDCGNDTIKAGQSRVLDTMRNYSIITAGTSALMPYSSYYDVPIKNLLKENLKKHSQKVSEGFIPVCSVTSGITHGWNFKLEWQRGQ